MKKYARKHLKDEKRILKLMYRTGMFDALKIDLKKVGWEYLEPGKKGRKRLRKRKYAFTEYLPELHVFFSDYWGEWDSKSVTDCYREQLWWCSAKVCDEMGFPVNPMIHNNQVIIKSLLDLPIIKNDSKINAFLKRNQEE